MTEDDLTTDQVRQLADYTSQCHRSIAQLLARMRQRQFSHLDELFRLTIHADAAMQGLSMHVHYLQFPGKGGHRNQPEFTMEHTPVLLPQPHEQREGSGNERRGE